MDKWVSASPAESAAAVAVRAVGGRLAAVGRCLKQVRQSSDEPRHVHQLRVWCRRADAALDLFAPLFPRRRTKRFRTQLKKLRRAAGEVRDMDVLAPRLVALTGEPISKKFRTQRAAAMEELLEHTTRRDGRRLKRRAGRLLTRVKPNEDRFGTFAGDRLRSIADAFFAADPPPAAGPDALHTFRIRGKALRYAVELVAAVLPPAVREETYTLLGTIQETLGTANDLATYRARLQRQADRATDPADVSHLRRQSAALQEELLAAQDLFRRAWTPAARETVRTQLSSSPLSASERGAGGEGSTADRARDLSPLTPLPAAGRGEPSRLAAPNPPLPETR